MSSFFFYEPFYDFELLIDAALNLSSQANGSNGKQASVQCNSSMDSAVRSTKPRMDLHEDEEQNVVTATFEFPGVSKDDVQIEVHNGKLTVSAERKQLTEHKESGYAVRERRLGKCSRTLQLPQGIKDEEIKASMDNGLLTLTFPKSTPDLAPKHVVIA